MSEDALKYKLRGGRVAKGSMRWGMPRCVVAFDEDTFAEIRALAIKNKTSFAQTVRELVEWGLEEQR